MFYLKAGMAALGATGILTKILIGLGLAATLLAVYGEWHHKIYQSGVRDTIAGIARADEKLVGRAKKARSKVLECQAAGRAWDQSTGACK